jgi:hypothetical protein
LLNEHTLTQLRELRLDGMVYAVQDQAISAAAASLTFEERLGMLVQREVDWRDGKRLERLLKAARLKVTSACIEDIDWSGSRGLDRSLITALAGGGFDIVVPNRPGVPIIITTQNPSSTTRFDAAFNALSNDLVGQSLPVSPPLLASTTISDVWLMDTRQAYGNTWQSSLMQDYLHPTGAGYQVQADWIHLLAAVRLLSPLRTPIQLRKSNQDITKTS